MGGIQYTGSTIDFIQTEEGIARNNSGTYSYEYNLTDHLGNVRYTFNKHPITGAIQQLQADDYYAFGKQKIASAGNNKYLYNGKELQDELGQYDYGARFYDAEIGRWNSVDPYAKIYADLSPYNYTLSNPIRYVDPDGLQVQDPIQIKEVVITPSNAYTNQTSLFWRRVGYGAKKINAPVSIPITNPNVGKAVGFFKFLGRFIGNLNIILDIHDQQLLTKRTPEQLLDETDYESETRRGDKVYKKKGNMKDVEKDFDDIVVENTKEKLNDGGDAAQGWIGRSKDGRVVVARDRSSNNYEKGVRGGDPTLEIRNPATNKADKIRYTKPD